MNCSGLTTVIVPDNVTSIDYKTFYGCSGLKTIYYGGSANEWSAISISSGNSPLTNATRYYYSETEPAEAGNYWHYGTDGEPVIW